MHFENFDERLSHLWRAHLFGVLLDIVVNIQCVFQLHSLLFLFQLAVLDDLFVFENFVGFLAST